MTRRHNARRVPALAALLALAAGCPAPGPATPPTPAVPSGTVVAFAGSEIPAGWTVCDGRSTSAGRATPDLRERFVLGAVPGEAVGQAGGSAKHAHRASTGKPDGGIVGVDADNDAWAATSNHGHAVHVAEAEHLPPFVRLVYIMKD